MLAILLVPLTLTRPYFLLCLQNLRSASKSHPQYIAVQSDIPSCPFPIAHSHKSTKDSPSRLNKHAIITIAIPLFQSGSYIWWTRCQVRGHETEKSVTTSTMIILPLRLGTGDSCRSIEDENEEGEEEEEEEDGEEDGQGEAVRLFTDFLRNGRGSPTTPMGAGCGEMVLAHLFHSQATSSGPL
ncbi:hypothetical protein BYT27DRAFT_7261758 [Phlegmacium glaucopus]|nr:hypothetical protein BYT27DRAFT_7261758 [Phlegmacium glaucopus]